MSSAKRKIGGAFGSRVGASTRQKTAGAASWRSEVEPADADEGGADNSDSDVALNPGTPLPSDSEDEKAVPAKEAEPIEEASALDEQAAGNENASAAGGAVEAASEAPAEPAASPNAVVLTLELVIGGAAGGASGGPLQVLLPGGLDASSERLLVACAGPEGAQIESSRHDGLCIFGTGATTDEADASKSRAKKAGDEEQAQADGERERGAVAASQLTEHAQLDEERDGSAAAGPAGQTTGSAGWLCAPLQGQGLALALVDDAMPVDTHQQLGIVLKGRRVLRRLAALAPFAGGPKLSQTAALRAPPAPSSPPDGAAAAPAENGAASDHLAGSGPSSHPVLHVRPCPPECGSLELFSWESEIPSLAAEELEVAELEINSREADVSELKQMKFGKERQGLVFLVEDALVSLEKRLGALEADLPATRSVEAGSDAGDAQDRKSVV